MQPQWGLPSAACGGACSHLSLVSRERDVWESAPEPSMAHGMQMPWLRSVGSGMLQMTAELACPALGMEIFRLLLLHLPWDRLGPSEASLRHFMDCPRLVLPSRAGKQLSLFPGTPALCMQSQAAPFLPPLMWCKHSRGCSDPVPAGLAQALSPREEGLGGEGCGTCPAPHFLSTDPAEELTQGAATAQPLSLGLFALTVNCVSH